MFAFLLVVCSTVHSGVTCLPPQRYKDLATCRAVGDTYRRANVMLNPYNTSDMYNHILQARCVKVAQ